MHTGPTDGSGSPRRVAVTGATGFIGVHVCADLARRGLHVRALVRRRSFTPSVIEESVVPDFRDRPNVERAIAGVDAVVHLAGHAHVLRGPEPTDEFQRTNVEVTQACAEAAASCGVSCFVTVSSIAAVVRNDAGRVDDSTVPAPANAYGRSKLAGEESVLQVARAAGFRAPVLRPPMVYGPGMKGNPLRLFRLVSRGVPIPLGAVRNERSILYVGNLAAAIASVLDCQAAGSERFLVADEKVVSTPDLVRLIAGALGCQARLVPVPMALLRLGAVMGDYVSHVRPFPLTSSALDGLVGSLVVDDSKLRRATGFTPPYTIEEGLRLTATWFKGGGRF